MKALQLLVSFCFCILGAFAQVQDTFSAPYSSSGVGTLQLSSLSTEEFTTFSHPAFPGRGARIKRSNFCDGEVASYTGYIDIGPRHLFFYFFESRNDPDRDDVIMWTNGGPGGSSAIGLFTELGPCWIAGPNSTKYNPYSWNSNANIFFVDQPIGVGYSYHDLGNVASTTEEAAKDIAGFVATFFETFDKFKRRNFHLSGESYAGRYLPLFGAAIYDQNELLIEKGLAPVNLKSVMIGNGATDFFTLYVSSYDISCTNAGIGPLLPISTCVRMKQTLPRCKALHRKSCVEHWDLIDCGAAFSFCDAELSTPVLEAGYNAYDMSMKCDSLKCYPEFQDVVAYLNSPSVRKAIGVEIEKNFTDIAFDVNQAFAKAGDIFHESQQYLAELLVRRVKVLIYAGENDFIGNWLGNERWTLTMDWSDRDAFASTPLTEWTVEGEPAGRMRAYGNFSFATIYDAGHFVPHDKPVQALALVQHWLADESL